MTRGTFLTLANGHGIDLLAPMASDIDFAVIAEHLAKENRYNGATPSRVYSVAEHSIRGANAILLAPGDNSELAAYFLLHDGHEAFLKDDTTPKKRALAAKAEQKFGVLAAHVLASFDEMTDDFDAAIHEAAGLAWPPTQEMRAQIKHWDLVMFVTEWRDLMGNQKHPDWTPYAHITPLPDQIMPWSWMMVRDAFVAKCVELLPALKQGRGR